MACRSYRASGGTSRCDVVVAIAKGRASLFAEVCVTHSFARMNFDEILDLMCVFNKFVQTSFPSPPPEVLAPCLYCRHKRAVHVSCSGRPCWAHLARIHKRMDARTDCCCYCDAPSLARISIFTCAFRSPRPPHDTTLQETSTRTFFMSFLPLPITPSDDQPPATARPPVRPSIFFPAVFATSFRRPTSPTTPSTRFRSM